MTPEERNHEKERLTKPGCYYGPGLQFEQENILAIIADLEAELVNPLRTYCAYCGYEVPIDDEASSIISEHIKTCPKHPMRKLEVENADLKNQITIFERNEANYVELLQESDNCAAGPWRPLRVEDKDGRDFLAKIQYRQDSFPEDVKVFLTVIWWEKEDSSWRNALEPYNDEEILEVAEIEE